MKKYFFLLAVLVFSQWIYGQTLFYSTMKIEFEKTVNIHNQMKADNPEWFSRIKDRLPKTSTSYFDFIADNNKSVYKPGREVIDNNPIRFFGQSSLNSNIIYTNFDEGKITAQKPVFEETFLMQDSIASIKWKITADTRNIAGFECRKAVGILFDTIGVFAFYTDELMISGGPEGIHGLPGMILGVAIPRLHTTWFATKVEINNVPVREIAPEKKGKKVTRIEMVDAMKKALKGWGGFSSLLVAAVI